LGVEVGCEGDIFSFLHYPKKKQKRSCLKSTCILISQIKYIETDIDYQYVKIFRQAQYDIKLYFSDSLILKLALIEYFPNTKQRQDYSSLALRAENQKK